MLTGCDDSVIWAVFSLTVSIRTILPHLMIKAGHCIVHQCKALVLQQAADWMLDSKKGNGKHFIAWLAVFTCDTCLACTTWTCFLHSGFHAYMFSMGLLLRGLHALSCASGVGEEEQQAVEEAPVDEVTGKMQEPM